MFLDHISKGLYFLYFLITSQNKIHFGDNRHTGFIRHKDKVRRAGYGMRAANIKNKCEKLKNKDKSPLNFHNY